VPRLLEPFGVLPVFRLSIPIMKSIFSGLGQLAATAACQAGTALAQGTSRVAFLLLLAGVARAQTPCIAVAGPNYDVCSNTTLQIGAAPAAGYTYSWSPTTGLSNPNIANPRVTVYNRAASSVVRSYTVTATGPSGCSATSTVTITVKPGPIADPGRDTTVCSGQVFMVGTPAIAGYTYQWPVGNAQAGLSINNPNLAQPTYTATNTGNAPFFRNVLLRVRAPNGCDTLVTLVVTVNPAVVAAAGPDLALCAGTPGTIGTPGVPGYTYSWSPATGLSSANAAQPTVTPTTGGAVTYTLTATNNGCSSTDQVVVAAYPAPVANAGPALTVCAGQAATLAAGIVPVAGTVYQWSPTTGLSNANVLSPTLTLATAGTFTYTLTATTAPAAGASCTATATVAVTVASRPVAVAAPAPGGPVSFCSGETRQLGGAAAVPGVTYRWRPATGLRSPTAATTAITLSNSTAAPVVSVYTLVATTAAGCADSSQVTVTVNPISVANAGPAATLCAGRSVTLGGPALPGYTYSWSPATGLSSATAAQPVLLAANSTAAPLVLKYYVTATQASIPGSCPGRDSVLITVNPAPALAAIAGPAAVCDLSQSQRYSLPTVPGATYQWTVTGGSVVAGQGTAQVTVLFVPGAAGYAVSAVVTSAAGCPGPLVSRPITFASPTVALTVASVAEASNNQVTLGLAATGSNPVQVLRRVAGAGSFAPVGTAAPAATAFTDSGVDAAANSYEYRLDLTNACGDILSSTLAQTVRLVASNAGTGGTGGRDQGNTTLTWNAYVGFPVKEYRLFRSADSGPMQLVQTLPATAQQTTVPNDNGGFVQQFRVVAVSTAAASLLANSNTASVSFANTLHTYNVITPNADGLNDVFVIDNIGLYPGNTLRIFTRWGREIFHTTNYQNTWGNAPDVAAGVYFYQLQLPQGSPIKGWVEVVK
jgi:gliding motility-associated-like protein